MGLQEKKTAKAIEDQYLGDYQKEINEVTGKELHVNINWDTFELDFMKFIPSVCLQRLTDAFKEVCADDMGKEAIQESINSVEVYCIPNEGAEAKKELKIEDGVFSLTACWGGHHSGYFSDLVIREFLENNL
ncbi:hypothetical protein [Leeuwenhoekiella marinoflava]|uniref:Uncharacterized protein n=2 Tax=Leeuwenhoekiella marinoflava TaxID=988 RepID=A0A4Q0PP92_9FLAO|nr:hypothetical protein [Leeuwenhoekiella marinoflava]RXG32281.1 hypothetical protein DSL99_1087 [Leeuwenhoekiella marinoflava]SHE80675.1 hypothetical protein SAMN02745246_01072 [Leeuwenhoekiella marinoflava DSM 3653]